METVKNCSKAAIPLKEGLPIGQIVFWHRDWVPEVTRQPRTEGLNESLKKVSKLSLFSTPGWVQPGKCSVGDVHDVAEKAIIWCGHPKVCSHKANGLTRTNKVLDIFTIHINSDQRSVLNRVN